MQKADTSCTNLGQALTKELIMCSSAMLESRSCGRSMSRFLTSSANLCAKELRQFRVYDNH